MATKGTRSMLASRIIGLSAVLLLGAVPFAALAQSTDKAITVALSIEPDSLDSCDTQTAQNANVVLGNVYETLTQVSTKDGTVQPLLLESWTHDSPLVWTFKLKQNVKFQDGTAFDAETAADNITRTQAGTDFYGGKLACYNSEQFDQKVTPKVIDANTLELDTTKPDPILPLRLSYVAVADKASQTKAEKITHPIGTGPYTFVSRNQGESIKLTRFDGYWGDKPQIKNVTYVYRQESSVRAGMIQTGEAQIATQIRAEDATDDDRTVSYKDNRILLIRANSFKKPFTDARVRQAVGLAIDRDTIIPAIMGKTGDSWYQMLGPQVNGYIPNFDDSAMHFNLDKAKQLLAAAKADGVPVDTQVLLITRPDVVPAGDEISQAIAQNLTDAGFNIKIMSMETSAWLKYLRQPFPADQPPTLQLISHDNTSGDASFSFPKYITCKGTVSATCNQQIDDLVAKAGTAEGQQRADLYQQAAKILYTQDFSMLGVAEQAQLMLLGPGVQYTPNPQSGIQLRIADVKLSN